jgi:tRNA pseudouridine55 synthase
VGHAGTLDPAAVGVLPVAFGRATRTTAGAAWNRKLYWADVCFGTGTDTDDATGNVIATSTAPIPPAASVASALQRFVGDIEQRPPAYSAVHVEGRRAYAVARGGGSTQPAPRVVRVDAIRVVGWQPPRLSLLISCRSGTYIRSIARDLGDALECPAHLAALARLRVGQFDITTSVQIDSLGERPNRVDWESVMWPADVATLDLDVLLVRSDRADDFTHGRAWAVGGGDAPGSVRVYDERGRFLGLAERVEEAWQPRLAIPLGQSAAAEVGVG